MRVRGVALLAVLAAGPAQGEDDTIVPDPMHAPAMVGGDVEGGYFRNWRGDLSCGTNAARAVFQITKLYTDPTWAPVMKIQLGEERAKYDAQHLDRDLRRVALEFVRFNPDQPLKLAVILSDGRREIQHDDYAIGGAVGQSAQVEIRWDESGVFTMKVNDQTLRGVHLEHAPTSVDFAVSSMQGQIGGIEVGRLGPPSAACAQAPKP